MYKYGFFGQKSWPTWYVNINKYFAICKEFCNIDIISYNDFNIYIIILITLLLIYNIKYIISIILEWIYNSIEIYICNIHKIKIIYNSSGDYISSSRIYYIKDIIKYITSKLWCIYPLGYYIIFISLNNLANRVKILKYIYIYLYNILLKFINNNYTINRINNSWDNNYYNINNIRNIIRYNIWYINISNIYNYVYILYKNNLQITNGRFKSYLVGISETTREISKNKDSVIPKMNNSNNDIKFIQWLAGLIDGNGYFGVTKSKYTSCEITVELRDEKALNIIKQKYGGSIKLRSGVKAIRWRLHNKEGMINLINDINGNIRNTKRLVQLHKVCTILDIPIILPNDLTINNSWFSGFFDADGTINFSFKNGIPQLNISVTNKLHNDVIMYKNIFKGNVYFDKSQNGYYKWAIFHKDHILNYVEYIKSNPSRTLKMNRILLCKEYYRLKELKAYKQPIDSPLYKAWIIFNDKWNKYDN